MASFVRRSTRIAGLLALAAAALIGTGGRAFGAVPAPAPGPHFQVVADPRAARPGDRVTVTLAPLHGRFTIVDCLVAFPAQDGGHCRRSSGRWIAETTVPRDARPGPTLLRWGVASRDADGRAAADNGSVEYEVLPPSTSHPPTAFHRSTQRLPAFVVAPDPSAAPPGDSGVAAVWGKRLQVIGWSVLGAVLLALPFAFGGIRTPIRRRWRRWRGARPNRPEDVESGDQVEIIPIGYASRSAVAVRDHERWPVHLIWTLPPIDPHLEEYR